MQANEMSPRFSDTNRQPGWRLLGTQPKPGTSVRAALSDIGGDFEVQLRPQFIDMENGTQVLSEKAAIVRKPTVTDPEYRVFGYASHKYQIVQNRQLADLVESLAQVWPLDTIGILGQGKTIFMSLNAGETEIGGEPVTGYFMITDTKDGGTSQKSLFTPVRMWCGNQLSNAMKQAAVSISLNHSDNIFQNLEWRMKLIERLSHSKEDAISAFRKMADVHLTSTQAEMIINAAYPLPNKPGKLRSVEGLDLTANEDSPEVQEFVKSLNHSQNIFQTAVELQNRRRETARELLEKMNDENPSLANTPWYGYNAVVEQEDYRQGNQADNTDGLISALWGERARIKHAAYNQAYRMSLAG